jgi:TonB-dependent Receptor Plug Domain
MKMIITSLMLLIAGANSAQTNSGEVFGRILNLDGKPIEYVKVYVQIGETYIKAQTDENGKFKLSAVASGNLDLIAVFEKDTSRKEIYVPNEGFYNARDWKIGVKVIGDVVVGPTMINITPGAPTGITGEDMEHSPNLRNPGQLLAGRNSEVSMTEDGDMIIRGSRAGDVVYMIDGVRIQNIAAIPGAAMKGMMVYTGAIPAKYGDTTGGVVILESKGYFDLLREYNREQESR